MAKFVPFHHFFDNSYCRFELFLYFCDSEDYKPFNNYYNEEKHFCSFDGHCFVSNELWYGLRKQWL